MEFSFNFGEIFCYPFVGNTGRHRVDTLLASVHSQLSLAMDAPAPGMGHASGGLVMNGASKPSACSGGVMSFGI